MRWLAVLMLGALAACGSSQEVSENKAMFEALRQYVKREAPTRVTLEQAELAITPAMIAKAKRRLVLVEFTGLGMAGGMSEVETNGTAETYWTPERQALVLDRGMAVSVAGFADPLVSSDMAAAYRAIRAGSGQADRRYVHLDGEGVSVRRDFACSYSRESGRVVERCRAKSDLAPAEIENWYVLGPGGAVKRSRQWLSLGIGYVRMSQVK